MPKYFVYEDKSGVCVRVEYDPDCRPYEIMSMRVLDRDYQAVGPNIMGMLDNLFVLTTDGTGDPFINMITKEIRHG